MAGDEKVLYLTFDDGPHPQITPFVLETLSHYQAKATFFCIGKNVAAYPNVFRQIIDAGHKVGNHTFNHLNGWKTDDQHYLDDIGAAKKYIDSELFRPPYGRITKFQAELVEKNFQLKTIMWDVLSGDFDTKITGEQCSKNVIHKAGPGSIIVFHDSEKAWPRLETTLPKVLRHFSEAGYSFKHL